MDGQSETKKQSGIATCGLILALFHFLLFPQPLLTVFSGKKELLQIGEYAFRVISLNFVPAGITIVVTSHLQGIAKMKISVFVIVLDLKPEAAGASGLCQMSLASFSVYGNLSKSEV